MRTRYKKLTGILLSLVLVMGMLPAGSMTVHADDKPAVKYLDENGDVKYCTDYTVVTENMDTTWNAGWYYVKDNVTFGSQIKANADVHIILGDNAKMSPNGGFFCGNNLSIYAQSTGENMGILEATPPSATAISAFGTVTIAGGNIIANGSANGFGIFSRDKNIIINGGNVKATAQDSHAIWALTDVIIYKGSVEAHGSGTDPDSHGYSGILAVKGNLEIHGGNLIASSGNGEALWAPGTNGKIINHLPGTGWTDTAGTAGETNIPVNTAGGSLNSYKKVEFRSPTTVKTAPTAKSLTFTGQPQELVTEGKTDCGTILYGLSKDANTEPTTWSESIPTGTDIKTYYVWYYVKGYGLYHEDSAKDKVAVTILPPRASEGDGQTVSIGTPATFRFDVDYNEFNDHGGVYVDGNPVDSKHYDAKPGSTVITLKEEFIDSLSEGEHTISVTLGNVSVGDATFTVTKAAPADNKSPATGDSFSNILLLFLISITCLIGFDLYTKKKELFK